MDKKVFEIGGASPYFYMPGEKVNMYFDVELTEDINAEALKKAADLTLRRFPYLAVKTDISENGDRYILTENEKPFPLTEKNGFVDIDSAEANEYLLTVSYYKNHIFSEIFHGLTDGMGINLFLRVLLKTYYELKENRSFDCGNIKSVWDAPDEDEWKDPMSHPMKTEHHFTLRKQKSFEFKSEQIDSDNVRLYKFSVPEKLLVDYAKKYEGGVSGAIALTLARAIDCIELENDLPIKIACPMDVRKMLGCAETMRNCTKSTAYTHSVTLRELAHEKQLSVLKGQMMLQSSEEYQLPRIQEDREDLEKLLALGSIEEKKQSFKKMTLKSTPIVSYLGKFDMGELNERIENISIYGKVAGGAGMQCVCLCFKGRCHISCSYDLKSDAYIRTFANEMKDFCYDCSPITCVGYDAPAKRIQTYKSVNNINALLYSSNVKRVKYAVVSVHGFAGHKESSAIQKLAEALNEPEGESALLSFDLPGHGWDKEPLSLELCGRYISAAADYMRKKYPDAMLILSGTSFGGYLSLKYACEHPDCFDKILLRCPAVKMGSTIKAKVLSVDDLRILREGGTVENGFDMKVKIRQSFLDELDESAVFEKDCSALADRMLIVQGTNDELVDWQDVKEFAERNSVRLILSEGADHRFLYGNTMADTIEDCVKFIRRQ